MDEIRTINPGVKVRLTAPVEVLGGGRVLDNGSEWFIIWHNEARRVTALGQEHGGRVEAMISTSTTNYQVIEEEV